MANRGQMKLRSSTHSAIVTASMSAKYCTSCQQSRYRQGGEYIKFNNGLNQRWICSWCVDRRKHATPQTEVSA